MAIERTINGDAIVWPRRFHLAAIELRARAFPVALQQQRLGCFVPAAASAIARLHKKSALRDLKDQTVNHCSKQ
jgi:hypothetical protein